MSLLVRHCFPLCKVVKCKNNAISEGIVNEIINYRGFSATYNQLLRETAILESRIEPSLNEEHKENGKLPQSGFIFVPFKMPLIKTKLFEMV